MDPKLLPAVTEVPPGFRGEGKPPACATGVCTPCNARLVTTEPGLLADDLAAALWTGQWNHVLARLAWVDRVQIIEALRRDASCLEPEDPDARKIET